MIRETTIFYQKIENSIMICGICPRIGVVEIPDTIEGIPVTAIAEGAFSIPEEREVAKTQPQDSYAIKYREVASLDEAKALRIAELEGINQAESAIVHVHLPDSIKWIGENAFFGCNQLTYLRLSDELEELPDYMLVGCERLERIALPERLKRIGNYAFRECRSLLELSLPETVVEIGRYAFYNCRELRKVNLPAGATNLGTGMFLNCEALYELEFGACQFVSDIISGLTHELLLTIDFPDGRAKLLVPDFQYEYIEDTPARMFHTINYGTGHLFRQCIGNTEIDFRRYDEMFYRAKREDEAELVLLFCVCRLTYPYRILEERRNIYLTYIREHILWATGYYIRKNDLEMLREFANWGLFTKENLPQILELAQKNKRTGIVSFLMDYEHRHFPQESRKKKFDL